jgi:GR25 family glycosyltransferase involved in LPS biosynthesis
MNQTKLNSISKCFFINLDRRSDRLNHIEENLPFFAERFEAIDGKSLQLDDKIIDLFPETYFKFSKAEVACALSHFKIWEKLVNDEDSDSYLILEDDVCFKDGFASYWNQGFHEHIPQDFSIIYLGGCQPWNRPYYKYVCDPENKFFNKVKKNDFFTKGDHYWHMNASSYIISKKAAIDLCSRIYDVGFSVALDHFLIKFLNHDSVCGDPEKFFHLNPLMAYQLHEKDGNTELDRNSDLRFSGEKFEKIGVAANQVTQERVNIKYWSDGRNNFGDELNIPVAQFLFKDQVCFNQEGLDKNIFLIGSNLGSDILDGDYICGVGIHHNSQDINTKAAIPKCVRGPLSLKWIKSKGYNSSGISIGDPALLLKLFYEPLINRELKNKIGVVPHMSNVDYVQSEIGQDDRFYLINPTNDWRQVVDEICSCSSIISSSLHGLICADAFNIPNVWLNIPGQSIPPCDENTNYGDFKYWDYLLSQDRDISYIKSIREDLENKLYCGGNNIDLNKLKSSIISCTEECVEPQNATTEDFPFIKKIDANEIPKKIHLSWRDKNVLESDYSLMKKGAKNLELLNPDWDIAVYDDEDINRLLRDSIGKDNWDLIKNKKITEKTDLWRLIKTYQEGGLYVDIDRYIDTPISEIINNKTKCVLPTYQDIDFSQDFILTCPKNPIMASGIVKNLEYRKQGKNLFFLAVYSYMHGVSDVVSGKIVERGENPEYFEDMRNKFKSHPNIETYRETGPNDHILYRNLNKDFSIESFEKDKAEFYNGSGVVHWNADTRKTHEKFNISTATDEDNSLLKVKQKYSAQKIMQVGLNCVSSIKSALASDEDSIVVTFDSCEGDVVVGKKLEIDNDFSGRHALVAGNINDTILEFAQNNNNFKFDLIFIDKVDTEIEVISALVNSKLMSHDKTVVCIDGSIDYMNTAWVKCVKQGYINETNQDINLKCATYQLKENETQSQLSIKQNQLLSIKDKWQDFIDYSFLNFAADNLIKDDEKLEDYSCFNAGKKIGIVSLYTDEIKDYAKYSEQDIKEYCLKNDYTFHIYRNSLDKSSSGNWSKAQAIMNHIQDHDSIVWMDSDVLIYNPENKFEDIINKCTENKKIIACEDIGANNKKLPKGSMFNSGVVIFKNHQYTVNLIQKWLDFDGDKSSLYASGGDQEILCNIIKKSDPFLFNVKIFPMNKFNTDPRMIDDDTFIVHFMAYPYHLKILFIRYWNKILSA